MSNETLLVAGVALLLASGLVPLAPGLAMLRQGVMVRQRAALALFTAGAALGLAAALRVLLWGGDAGLRWAWALPGAEFELRIDLLSAWFLLPVLLIPTLGAWYGLEYWRADEHPGNAARLLVFYGWVTAAMALVVTAANGVLFLAAWEVMALSAFLLVATEDEKPDVREASWIYLIATHAGTLLLFSAFGLYWTATGTFTLALVGGGSVAPDLANAIFLLALGGFGIKAGLFPLHVWLPPAHASAPSHVSALMSGVLIKMGVYGMVRVTWLFDAPPLWWGGLLLGLGVLSGVLGVAFALGQHDYKRLLAYHSIENIGIIFMGLGVAVCGKAVGDPRWIVLGLAGALLHTWNHGLFKTLLFLAAGAVLHRTHTREMDHLGGLAKRMPLTALGFTVGAVAICGLPPLNGFVSELFIYLGLFGSLSATVPERWLPAVVGIPALALIGALALACFVKVHGAVFLGEPRTEHARHARECGPAMTVPMAVLALACLAIGLFPAGLATLLDDAARTWAPQGALPPLAGLAPLLTLSGLGLALLAGAGALGWALRRRAGGAPAQAAAVGTWDCGYALPTPRMQYTGSSFGQLLVNIWGWALLPAAARTGGAQTFPTEHRFSSRVPDTVLERGVLPALGAAAWLLAWLRPLQRGRIQDYVLYIVLTLLLLLLLR
jgi:hydrogenase-4 component B